MVASERTRRMVERSRFFRGVQIFDWIQGLFLFNSFEMGKSNVILVFGCHRAYFFHLHFFFSLELFINFSKRRAGIRVLPHTHKDQQIKECGLYVHLRPMSKKFGDKKYN